ncbi:MAG: hypothetical protein KAH23_01050 [Kiritimatiellae bacterium]|nr:hypothetical protein [Kiritimatiellia bacterium]
MDDTDLLLQRLIKHDIEFVIVGGFAAVAYGITMVTMDIDICCRFSTDNLLRLQEALIDLNPIHRITTKRLPLELTIEKCKMLKNLYLSTNLGQLDCLGNIKGIGDYDEVLKQSNDIELDIGVCRILTINALIKAKQAMDRPRDKEAVLQLNAIKEKYKEIS